MAFGFSRVSSPVGSWTPDQAPDVRGYGGESEYLQPSAYADGGSLYVYDKGLNAKDTRVLSFSYLSSSDFGGLQTFFAAMKQGRYNFTMTDIDGNTHTARFLSGLNWEYGESGDLANVSFKILLET